MSQTISIFPIYIYIYIYILFAKRIKTFWSGAIKILLSEILCCGHTLKAFLPLPARIYYLPTLPVKIGSISFFSSSGMRQSHLFVGIASN